LEDGLGYIADLSARKEWEREEKRDGREGGKEGKKEGGRERKGKEITL
jgi:hypothetical protein